MGETPIAPGSQAPPARSRGAVLFRCLLALALCFAISACRPEAQALSIDVKIVVDGAERTYGFSSALTVDQVLERADIELGTRDRVSHPLVAQVDDGMRITIRRVREEQACELEEIAFSRSLIPREGVPAGATELSQRGQPGAREACYRLVYEDDIQTEKTLLAEPITITEPIAEIHFISTAERAAPLSIPGRLSYINHGKAWTIAGDVINKRALTQELRLDGLVFDQSEDGRRLLITSETDESDGFFNALWMVETAGASEPIRLTPTDVLYAEWRPRANNAFAYSTGESAPGKPGWKALNNLWLVAIDLETGRALSIKEILRESGGGKLGWWGARFAWSPHGDKMAWAGADGVGVVDFDANSLTTLVSYAVFHSASSWVWLSPLSWSRDSQLIASIAHGLPLGDEPAEKSPIFDVIVSSAEGRFSALLKPAAGMWSAPTYSPEWASRDGQFSEGAIAWLGARQPHNSMGGEYDLFVADRDGSNQRRLFPAEGAPGISQSDFAVASQEIAWSPDARFLALVYRGDLWLVEAESGSGHQVTFDGGSSRPVWTR